MAWALGMSGHTTPSTTLDAIAAAALGRIGDFTPQGLSSLVYSFAAARHPAPQLFDAVADQVLTLTARARPDGRAHRRATFTSQGLATLAWSYATVGHGHPRLFQTIGRLAQSAPPRVLAAQDMATLAWSFASLGHSSPPLFGEMMAELTRRASELSPQGLSNAAWAFAQHALSSPSTTSRLPASLSHDRLEALFRSLAPQSRAQVKRFSPRALTKTLWAFSATNQRAPELFDAAAAVVAADMGAFDASLLAQCAWAYAVADHDAPVLFTPAFGERFDETAEGPGEGGGDSPRLTLAAPSRRALVQLHQWLMWHQERGAQPHIPSGVASRARDAFLALEGEPSAMQVHVRDALLGIGGADVEEEHRTAQGWTVDLVLTWRGVRVAVEVDGPSHFLSGSSVPTGATALKTRMLSNLAPSTPLVNVAWFTWSTLALPEQPAYLTALLDAAVAEKADAPLCEEAPAVPHGRVQRRRKAVSAATLRSGFEEMARRHAHGALEQEGQRGEVTTASAGTQTSGTSGMGSMPSGAASAEGSDDMPKQP